ncbi:MAG: sensor domain-containing diguanylate cyclase [Pseudomonadota bacterium]
MLAPAMDPRLLSFIVDRVNVGIFVVDREHRLVLWNRFMEVNSGWRAEEVLGRNLFDCFPELPRPWLQRKIQNVFILKNFSFTAWEQRPYLFPFRHNRPVTGGVDYMRQNCTFMPVKDEQGEVQFVCVTLFDVTDTSIYQQMLKEAGSRDGLTGIFNRRHLEQTLIRDFDRARRYGRALAFLLLDVDHFKHINDAHGHPAGDEVLRTVAQRVGDCLRSTDTLGRYGGEEFAVVLPETDLSGARVLGERLRQAVAREPVLLDQLPPIPVTVSIGISELRPELSGYERLIHEADTALYHSKTNGRNRVSCAV